MKTLYRTTRIVLGSLALLSATAVYAQDWPQWRGPNRDNRVPAGFVIPATWPQTLTHKWSVTVGKGDASPVLGGDKVYVFARQGGDEILFCFDVSNGKEMWQNKYATPETTGADKGHPGPRSTPVVGDGKLCTFGVNGVLTCVDATSGKRLWQKDTKSKPIFHAAASPLIAERQCIACVGTSQQAEVAAYDLVNGAEKWKCSVSEGQPAYGSPMLMTVEGTKQVVAVTSKALVGISLADGKELWKYSFTGRYMNHTPIIDGDTIYYCGVGTGTIAIKIEKQRDKFIPRELWKVTQCFSQYNTPTLKGSLLYGIAAGPGRKGSLYCVDTANGKIVYEGGVWGECGYVLDAGAVLVALSQDGNLVIFEPGKVYKEVIKYKVANAPWTCPILAGNRVFIKDTDTLTLWTIE